MNGKKLSVFVLSMINVAAICNLKNFPITAELGLSAIFYYALATIFFFLPVSLISAELASGWPQAGGVYLWVKKAFGAKVGMLAIFLQWAENVIWYPSILSFTAASFAFLFNPDLANNAQYIVVTILCFFWLLTFLNLQGMQLSGWISTVGVIIGTLIPGIFMIFLAILWLIKGNASETPLTFAAAFPNILHVRDLGLLSGILLTLAGMEMSAVHIKDVENPKKSYPKAILLSSILIFLLTVLGGIAIAIVVPKENKNLAADALNAFNIFLKEYQLQGAIGLIALSVTLGAMGMISTWIIGPTKGLLIAAQDHHFPKYFTKKNAKGMPSSLLILQGIIVSILSCVFLFMPSVSSSYWILFNLTALLYLIVYLLIFASGIKLRYKYPEIQREYKIPFKNMGMWIVASLGILGTSFAFIMGFFPPSQIDVGNIFAYEAFLIIGIAVFCIIPFCIQNKQR